jgi:nucleoside-diphosphate-sugar epimerase
LTLIGDLSILVVRAPLSLPEEDLTMALHVIAGAGPVGDAVAGELLGRGAEVRVLTRSGSGIDGTERVAMDVRDADALSALTARAEAIYNCVNPPFHRWVEDWPALGTALLRAAESSGAVLANTGNLYGYGRVDAPVDEQTPLAATGPKGRVRNRVWLDCLASHRSGKVRTFEVRGSDYLGGNSFLAAVIAPAWRKGRTAWVPAALDVDHTFTDVRDVAELLVTGAADTRAWGRAWHVPSPSPVTMRTLAETASEQMGVRPRIRSIPSPAVWLAGLASPLVRELRETQHQVRRAFVLDSSEAQATFGLTPHSIASAVAFDLERGERRLPSRQGMR